MTLRRRDTQEKAIDGIALTLALAGLGINILLLTRTMGDAAIAGSGGGDCDEVLATRWSSLLGLPIPAAGIVVFGLLLLSHFRRLEILRPPLLGCITGAALWFIGVQAFILGKFCPWCMAAHGVGLALVGTGIVAGRAGSSRHLSAWAGLAVFAVAAMQVFGPERAGHRLEEVKSTGSNNISARDPAELPLLGPSDAAHVLTAYFDYQCAACRTLAGHLAALMEKHPRTVAVRLVPVPMERRCNPAAPATAQRPGSCEIAAIALAVWKRSPDRFADFHGALLADPSAHAARRFVLTLVEPGELAVITDDPRIEEAIRSNVHDWRGMARSNPQLPKLLLSAGRVLHGSPPGEETFIELMERELGL
ncbi:MAG TPA: vitamin K epoxide reductase family protein [Luteolibacter sp.]|nr:vitamin K epoxide reductase family protein [Luteolibacter sp.]